jgi:hypothetical protein
VNSSGHWPALAAIIIIAEVLAFAVFLVVWTGDVECLTVFGDMIAEIFAGIANLPLRA